MTKPVLYQIRIKEQLDDQWAEWFWPLVLHPLPGGDTMLSGHLRDQGELHGILNKVRDLNLTLLYVNSMEPTVHDASAG
jgi:hypothetical protein